ncbi:MAG: ABC transporter substrate-binding protein [Candidatus Binatia bacterium]
MENQAKRKLKIIYRSNSHAPLWVVTEKAGIWGKYGLEVDTSPQLMREKAVDALRNGHVDLISGNHHNLYARRAKNGEDFVHLAQVGNVWTENRMVAADSIREVKDLRGKKVAIGKLNSHAGLNVWLFLLQEGLNIDKGEVELVETCSSAEERWQGVIRGDFGATFVGTPEDLRAARAGAKIIRVRAMPMIRGVTLTTTMRFVRGHEEEIRRLLRGLAGGIHFFLTQKEETLRILNRDLSPILRLENDAEVEALYQEWQQVLERKPYPTIEAIANVFTLAVRRNPEIEGFNPLILWNTHYLRELDDSGLIDQLYQ